MIFENSGCISLLSKYLLSKLYLFAMNCNYIIEQIDDHKIEIPLEFKGFKYMRTIGEGAFAVVILVQNIHTHQRFACKVCSRKLIEEQGTLNRFEQELRILERIQHPNIVQIHQIIYLEKLIIIVMDYYSQGELYGRLRSIYAIDENQLIKYAQQILSALKYLHSMGICHRDIKLENICIDSQDNARLIDFGLSKENASKNMAHTLCGTLAYIPPEEFKGHEYDGKAADIWSLGIVLFVMATTNFPWKSESESGLINEIMNGNITIPVFIPTHFAELLRKMLITDPKTRWTAEQLLQLPVFKNPIMMKPLPKIRPSGSSMAISADNSPFQTKRRKGNIVIRTHNYANPSIIAPMAQHRKPALLKAASSCCF